MKSEMGRPMDLPELKAVLHPGNKALFLVISLVFCHLILSCRPSKDEIPYYAGPDFTPYWASGESFSLDTLHTIGPFSFTNQEGALVTNQAFKGKIYVSLFSSRPVREFVLSSPQILARLPQHFQIILMYCLFPTALLPR
jgi:hypothetical protein